MCVSDVNRYVDGLSLQLIPVGFAKEVSFPWSLVVVVRFRDGVYDHLIVVGQAGYGRAALNQRRVGGKTQI